jgi:hypothetical protein
MIHLYLEILQLVLSKWNRMTSVLSGVETKSAGVTQGWESGIIL